jgi:hypothetical protein
MIATSYSHQINIQKPSTRAYRAIQISRALAASLLYVKQTCRTFAASLLNTLISCCTPTAYLLKAVIGCCTPAANLLKTTIIPCTSTACLLKKPDLYFIPTTQLHPCILLSNVNPNSYEN